MTNFLSKPFSPDQLFDMLTTHLHEETSPTAVSLGYSFSETLDQAYLQQAYGTDINYGLEMFITFTEVIEEDLILVREYIDSNKRALLKGHLHRIKPSFTMVGMKALTERIESIEDTILKAETQDIRTWYEAFESQFNILFSSVNEEIEKMKLWQSNLTASS